MVNALPLLLRFYSDRQVDVPLSLTPFANDVLRLVSGALYVTGAS